MKVFLSWSGSQSLKVAEILRSWLPNVIQSIEPWLSSEDINKGRRWTPEIAAQLEDTKAGIVCVTPGNQREPWLNFEAGALSKAVKSNVCTYLVGLKPADVDGPLGQFQATEATQADTQRLLTSLNKASDKPLISDLQLNSAFRLWWPELEKLIAAIPPERTRAQARTDRAILEEVLENTRDMMRLLPANDPPLDRLARYLSPGPVPTDFHRRTLAELVSKYIENSNPTEPSSTMGKFIQSELANQTKVDPSASS